ncbi:MarR family transcriptional regulator [Gaiella sp.]|uniref:MarR family winged helix-turn-helix transcriptional regulator n=1 Tax=Gaiella sp. TaxID=2663207 RepID=UPI00326786B3
MQVSSVNSSLSPVELAAWRGLLRTHAALVRDLDAELHAGHDLSLHEYEVLLTLAGAPEGRMRMSELAAAVVLSQSGLTRLVDRLGRDGFVARVRCEGDRRGLNAEVTDAGRRRYLEARTTHLAGVRRRFLDHLDESELGTLATFWERVVPGATAE